MKKGDKINGGFSSSSIVANSDGDNVTITIPKSALTKYSSADGTESDSSDKKGYFMLAGMSLILIGVIYFGNKLLTHSRP